MIKLVAPNPGNKAAVYTQVDWLNHPDIMRFSEQRHVKHTLESQQAYIQSFLDHPDHIMREICSGDEMVGTITAYVDRYNRVANVGILLGMEHWGRGYGYQAWAQLCDSLFDNVGMRRIEAGCMAKNAPMINLMRRYGMSEEGRRPSHFIVDGTYSDLVLYGRFR